MSETLAPTTEAEIGDAVREAHDSRSPLEIRGGGTRGGLGRPIQAATTLSTAALTKVIRYEPGALSLVVEAGAPVSAVEESLAAEGQRLPFEPMDHRGLLGASGEPTIGGVVACAVSGPRRVQAGACRDSLLGVRFVDGRGDTLKNGGRVMKNVTGYDLSKLMCGAFGTLGVLTEVSFKVLPTPARGGSVVLRGLSLGDAVAAMSAALGSPYDVSGAAHMPAAEGGAVTALRIEGFEQQFGYRRTRLEAVLHARLGGGAHIEALEGPAHDALWRDVRDVKPLWGYPGVIWRLSVKPSAAAGVVDAITQALAPAGSVSAMLDWGGGLIWLGAPESDDGGAAAIRRTVAAHGGHATLVRAPAAIRLAAPVFHPEPPRLAALARDLRAAFDPAGILNPGRVAQQET